MDYYPNMLVMHIPKNKPNLKKKHLHVKNMDDT